MLYVFIFLTIRSLAKNFFQHFYSPVYAPNKEVFMYFSKPFCMMRPDFKAKRYKDYQYIENIETGEISAKFTTPAGRTVKCNFNTKTGNGYKIVRKRGYVAECLYKNFKPARAIITTLEGEITRNFITGFTSIMSHDNKIEHGITNDGQIVELNTEKMYRFWQKFGFYKIPTMKRLKAVMEKIITCRRV